MEPLAVVLLHVDDELERARVGAPPRDASRACAFGLAVDVAPRECRPRSERLPQPTAVARGAIEEQARTRSPVRWAARPERTARPGRQGAPRAPRVAESSASFGPALCRQPVHAVAPFGIGLPRLWNRATSGLVPRAIGVVAGESRGTSSHGLTTRSSGRSERERAASTSDLVTNALVFRGCRACGSGGPSGPLGKRPA
jgi:hypothetical protein